MKLFRDLAQTLLNMPPTLENPEKCDYREIQKGKGRWIYNIYTYACNHKLYIHKVKKYEN